MSTAESWDLTVPEDEAELLAELRRHGVRPGSHLHVLETPSEEASASIRRALEAFSAVVASGLDDKIKAVLSQLDLPKVDAPAAAPPALNEAQRAALIQLLAAVSETQAAARSVTAEIRRADLPFIGSGKGGPPDLAARTDEHLAEGFGR